MLRVDPIVLKIDGKQLRARMRSLGASIALLAIAFLYSSSIAASESRRPYRVSDIFELESIGNYFGGPYAFSPDGRSLAFTRVRPKHTLANHKWEYLWGNAGGDIWVQLKLGEPPVNITMGALDGSGWWAPQWSHDGRRMAMLSTRGGNVRLWLWDRQSDQIRPLSERAVDIDTQSNHQRPFLWLDAQHLLYPVLAKGRSPLHMRIEVQTPKIASREWPKTPKGEEATASVLDSGVPVDLSRRPRGQLRLLDIVTGQDTVVVKAAVASWRVSPQGEMIAFTQKVGPYLPKAGESLSYGLPGTFTVGVATLEGTTVALEGEISRDVLRDSLRWSLDGQKLAFLGYAEKGRSQPPRLYSIDLSERRVTELSLGQLDAAPIVRKQPQLEWTAEGNLVLLAAEGVSGARPDVHARRDWWRIGGKDDPQVLTADLKDVPEVLLQTTDGQTFVGLAGGELWRVDPGIGKVESLTVGFQTEIDKIVWPTFATTGIEKWPRADRAYAQLIVGERTEDGQILLYRVDLADGLISAIGVPAPNAELKAYCPDSDTAIYYRSDGQGLFLWRRDLMGGPSNLLVAANTYLRDIAPGSFRSINYTSLDGEPLKAWLLLPPDYREGRRYPLLTRVYAGSVAGPVPPLSHRIGYPSSLNMQIPAAQGYAVLFPSMPLETEGTAEDVMLRLPNGVLPAVDKVIAMGIADPERLFLIGQSFGGYSVYGLITQTDRFTAAVSLAGPSNLISLYGQFDARFRYTAWPQEQLSHMARAELLMGNPPWKDAGHYLRNSPIFQVDRVETPVMIIQGDLDYVAMQQGEEFFNALYRQGKRARFVRYWGEGHVLQSPANIDDLWGRIFDWFEELSVADNKDALCSPHAALDPIIQSSHTWLRWQLQSALRLPPNGSAHSVQNVGCGLSQVRVRVAPWQDEAGAFSHHVVR